MARSPVGLDIGGANLKAAHLDGTALSRPFPLWQNPAALPEALRELVQALPANDLLAVTMTGELCDCFASQREGVHAILAAVAEVAESQPVLVWQATGQFVDLETAKASPHDTAAANWLALATLAGRYAPQGSALLLDIGSTTSDIVPLLDGVPVPRGRTDPDRLRLGELVYTGVRRTPLCALLSDGHAAELFATTLDAYLTLGRIAEDEGYCHTADSRPATLAAAHARLARMRCADPEQFSERDRRELALLVQRRQLVLIRDALNRVGDRSLGGPPGTVILAGEGEFLGQLALTGFGGAVVSLQDQLGAGAVTGGLRLCPGRARG